MMEMIINGMLDAFTLITILYVAAGVFIGVTVGAIPGLSGTLAIALAVPLTYTMAPVVAFGFLVGINKGSSYGSSISAILLNTPGSAEAAATTLDGYPLALQGKGNKAMKLSLSASIFGDLFATCLLICVAAPIAAMALKMGPAEILLLIIFALSMIAALESASLAKGLLAAAFGMLIKTVGIDQVVGQPRLTFGMFNLESGLDIVTIAIGLLALSEMLMQTEQMGKKATTDTDSASAMYFSDKPEDNKLSFKEIKSCFGTMARSSGIGAIVGALPGLGSAVAAFLAYGAAKKSARNPEEFGKGSLQGVAAPESANNAVVCAALIPLFTLGIPGSLTSALLIGVFIMHGITVGPLMFEQQGQMVYGIYGTIIIGNIALMGIGFACIRLFTKVLTLSRQLLFPVIMFVCMVGAYLAGQTVFCVGAAISFAVLGYLMKKLQFSFVCFIVGFILERPLEMALQQTIISYSDNYFEIFTRPACVVLIFIIILFLTWQLVSGLRNAKRRRASLGTLPAHA